MDCKRLERAAPETYVKVECEVTEGWNTSLATFFTMKNFSAISYVTSDKISVLCFDFEGHQLRTGYNRIRRSNSTEKFSMTW
jgi:hypothetical protein